jgi:hypothetical protein
MFIMLTQILEGKSQAVKAKKGFYGLDYPNCRVSASHADTLRDAM